MPSRNPNIGNAAMLAEMYQERGEVAQARKVLESVLLEAPSAASTLCALGKLELRSGAAERALEHVSRCLQVSPVFPDGWFLLGLALEAGGDREGAAAAHLRQLEFVPGHELSRARLEALRTSAR
jgi:Flp pilus assembly protein TadD